MVMAVREPNRTLCTCREAAKVLGVTMGRVRQMCRKQPGGGRPVLWSAKFTGRALMLDLEQVNRLAKERRRKRDTGELPGRPAGGFSPDT